MSLWKLVLAASLVVFFPPRREATVNASTQAPPPIKADFNCDGWEDLAIGAPYEDAPGAPDAGAVSIVYGSQTGLTPALSQFFQEGVGGELAKEPAEPGDLFGQSLAAGDFNEDGCSDLAIGAPGEDYHVTETDVIADSGMVIVLPGSTNGLLTVDVTAFYQGETCLFAGQIEGKPGVGDYFGASLAAGDFNRDGRDDLAIGVPGETGDAGYVLSAGAVNVVYGTSVGLNCQDDQIWHQGSPIQDSPEAGDNFGRALSTGDFDGDSYEDLAIGAPLEQINGVPGAGAVNILYGSALGLDGAGNQLWHEDSGAVPDTAEENDYFGLSLATGFFDKDAFEDLAVGVPLENVYTGAVIVLYGAASGLDDAGSALLSQATAGVPGTPQEADSFGFSLAAGDFDADGMDDLAVGVPTDREKARGAASGAVNVFYGTSAGLVGAGSQIWDQGSPGILDDPESLDQFGLALGAGDFNGDGAVDLAVGVPWEDLSGVADEGIAQDVYGSSSGLSGTGSGLFSQGLLGQTAQAKDQFGWALTTR